MTMAVSVSVSVSVTASELDTVHTVYGCDSNANANALGGVAVEEGS